MKVLLLAAGRSRRVKPIEDKNFLKFFGKTLLEHQLDRLKAVGLRDFLIVGGAHNLGRLQKLAKAYRARVFEQKNLDQGMAGAILTVEKAVGHKDLLIVSSNDVVEKAAYEALLKASQSEGDSFLLCQKTEEYFPGGYLKLEGELKRSHIIGIVEKPKPGKEPSKLVNIVVHLHKKPKDLFEALKKVRTKQDDRYEKALAQLMKKRVFKPILYSGFWQAIKQPWHILNLMQESFRTAKRVIHPRAQIAKTALIKGHVVIERGVKILDYAVVEGPAYIGKNSIIGNHALVRESIIGDRCIVGFSTEIARSFIGDDSWFHLNYVGDTVMGDDCRFGAGAVCANFRLDGANIKDSGRNKLGPILGSHIRVGVNTSLMPGVRIGSNSMITSGLVIAEDIEPGKFVSGKINLKIKNNRA